jgi:predicted nucleotide-binding protein
MFRESLSVTGSGGSGILDTAIAELRLLMGRLKGRVSTLSANEVNRLLSGGSLPQRDQLSNGSSRVFIVHGHDGEAREAVARFVAKVGLNPVILHEQASAGQTIIEKLEKHGEVSFAIVLLTPDDLGATGTMLPPTLKARARQNVILELGYFIGTLGRNRVCVLYRPDVELPSDMLGVVYVPYDSSGSWRLGLARELKAAGLKIDADRVL